MNRRILVLVKKRGKNVELGCVSNSMEAMEKIIGGTIEETWLSGKLQGIVMLTNLDAKELHKGSNFTIDGIKVRGTAVFCQSVPSIGGDDEYETLDYDKALLMDTVFYMKDLFDAPAKLL